MIDSVLVTKNIGAEEYKLLDDNISIFEFLQLKVLVPVFASPDIDWYNMTPQLSILFLFPMALHFNSELSSTLAVFLPSTTTIWAPVEVPLVLLIVISPVEYIIGLPAPSVDKSHSVQVTFPSPLSVAKVAHDPPFVDIVTLDADIEPPKVAWSPLAEPEEVDVMVASEIATVPLFVATIAFAPFADVEIVPPIIVTPPPWTKTAAFTP